MAMTAVDGRLLNTATAQIHFASGSIIDGDRPYSSRTKPATRVAT